MVTTPCAASISSLPSTLAYSTRGFIPNEKRVLRIGEMPVARSPASTMAVVAAFLRTFEFIPVASVIVEVPLSNLDLM